jgi:hypothetical protein
LRLSRVSPAAGLAAASQQIPYALHLEIRGDRLQEIKLSLGERLEIPKEASMKRRI